MCYNVPSCPHPQAVLLFQLVGPESTGYVRAHPMSCGLWFQ